MWVGGESRNGEMMDGREDTPRQGKCQGWVWEVGGEDAGNGGAGGSLSLECIKVPLLQSQGKCELQPLCVGPDGDRVPAPGEGLKGEKEKEESKEVERGEKPASTAELRGALYAWCV